MNDILQLKGSFEQKSSNGRPGAPKLPKGTSVDSDKLKRLCKDLVEMEKFWKKETVIKGALITVYYNKIAAKSNRVSGLLTYKNKTANDTIVGAKFSEDNDNGRREHIITHYVSLEAVAESISLLKKTIKVIDTEFSGEINALEFNKKDNLKVLNLKKNYDIAMTTFQKIIVDAYFVKKFDIEKNSFDSKKSSIITIYETGNDTQKLLDKIGIKVFNDRILNDTTILLDENYLEVLMQKAPYLVSMATENITELAPSDFSKPLANDFYDIPSPTNEPIIGVIDTLFDNNVYFSEWVDFHNMVDPNIPIEPVDYVHGTAVSSIIVDGPRLNPTLQDNCNRFRVRHFGVSTNKAFSSFKIIRDIKQIVASNRDIHVWNLSLGSNEEVNQNFISAEGAILDQIQYENDVIFVIAGTNKKEIEATKKIGAPADSINSIVVNSVDSKKEPADYSREGIVLSFFAKPDVSYYGGTKDEKMTVCGPSGKYGVSGTSYAAPWISRKLSYLIDIIGLNKETAKALLIDSAIGWNGGSTSLSISKYKGYGVVPIKIEDIINTPNDEIKFVVSGISEKYDTFNYNFPVPIHKGKYPFIAKATLSYFPKCSRNQGVDYTNTELDVYFGRLDDKGKLKSINNNKQSLEGIHYLKEENARKQFRKWDNVKHISEEIKPKSQGKKVYENNLWAMSIKTKERLNNNDGEGIRFGVVVTLKEINGVNRIEDFIQQCSLKGWLVNRINVHNRIDIYQTASQTIELE